jgi:hypothetical protein
MESRQTFRQARFTSQLNPSERRYAYANTLIAKYEKDAAYFVAVIYVFRGQADKAFEWLDKAVEYGDSNLIGICSENLFDNIHSDPRWLPFLRKIGQAPDQVAKIKFRVTLPK